MPETTALACDHCLDDCDNVTPLNGQDICDHCHDTTSKCINCAERDFDDDMTYVDGEYWCDSCYCDSFTCCEGCSDSVHIDDCRTCDNGTPYCETCYSEKFTTCDGCNCEIDRNDYHPSECGGEYCEECYYEHFDRCYSCGCEVPVDDARRDSDGDAYCEDCYKGDDWSPGDDIIGHFFNRTGSQRRYGVELEGSRCDDYADLECQTSWGACDDGTSGVEKEFYSPILQGDEGFDSIDNVCEFAQNNDWEVNHTCGFHLHIDCTDLSLRHLEAVAAGYAETYEVWASFVSKSRRNNQYCKPHTYSAEETICADWSDWKNFTSSSDRYTWVNWQAYHDHETLEVRLHSGTFNARKVYNWVAAHTRFVDWCASTGYHEVIRLIREARCVGGENGVFRLMSRIWGDAELTEYYKQRANKFGTHYMELALAS